MKKVIATSLAFTVLLGLSACGGRSDDTPIEKPSSVSAHTTEPTTSDVIEYDPLENVVLSFSPNCDYPESLQIDYDYNFAKAEEQKSINGYITSADSKQIIIELTVDENAVAEYFGNTPYVLKNTKKEIIFDTSDIYCRPLYAEFITDSIVSELNENFQREVGDVIREYNGRFNANDEYSDELSVKAVYVGTFAENRTYLADFQLIEKGNFNSIIDIISGNDLIPYELWFAYENKDGKVFLKHTIDLKVKNGEYFCNNKKFDIYENTYDSLEAAKKSIEDSIAGYDNVQLEELPIPESLK